MPITRIRFWPLALACMGGRPKRSVVSPGLPRTQAERLHVKGGQNLASTDIPPPVFGNPGIDGDAGGYRTQGNHPSFGGLGVDLL